MFDARDDHLVVRAIERDREPELPHTNLLVGTVLQRFPVVGWVAPGRRHDVSEFVPELLLVLCVEGEEICRASVRQADRPVIVAYR